MARLFGASAAAWRLWKRPAERDPLIDALVATGRLQPLEAYEARPAGRRATASGALQLELDGASDRGCVIVVRHPSRAITLHAPDVVLASRRGAAVKLRFTIRVSTQPPQSRRGPAGAAIRVFVLRVAGAILDRALPQLAATWEERHWRRAGLETGFVHVTAEALRAGRLPRVGRNAFAGGRSLLLLHGTFSCAESAFAALAGGGFFEAVRSRYGDRVFAFNHFTVSASPEDNARALLDALPDRRTAFDVVTHSRGALVLRYLVERRAALGAAAKRFAVGRAVLAAAPNQGTPLASPSRWDGLLGWVANLVDLFPDSPLTFGAAFVSEGLAWMARRIVGTLPGLAPMGPGSDALAELQGPPGPPAASYSALVANYEPDAALSRRIVDAGADVFFAGANDLVVPTEGGWRVDAGCIPAIPGERIACFGPGGNLSGAGRRAVHHLNLFSRPETVDFLVRALKGEPQPLAPQAPDVDLPHGAGRRSRAAARAAARPKRPRREARDTREPLPAATVRGDDLQLFIVSSKRRSGSAELLAMFRNARVLAPFETRGGAAGQRWQRIIRMQERILAHLAGRSGARGLPTDSELKDFGATLFETLFPGDVRRLYDVARSVQTQGRLDLVFTSMIDWVADKPWELAYDRGRDSFLATDELNFVRNALTAVPAERIDPRPPPLRLLLAAARPLETAPLSAREEAALVARSFTGLEQAGLVAVDVMPSATPERLHRRLVASRYDVLHFVGHGEYDEAKQTGYLLLEDDRGRARRLDASAVRRIFGRRGVRLVFLNACETGRGGRADFNRGLAPALVAAGVPAVVANQYPVLDVSATAFARHFYGALAEGQSLGDAARESRIAVSYQPAAEVVDWAVPVVYARDPREVLCRAAARSR